ncbi:transcriptional regulator [Candidatus Magnetobacterium bavaricum]|uniref:Transcriptional regulator n=1 Tax=Candidatus Magnetobacterium bavaricum TaxID=29290 RepID=A0A0F3GIV4_9BACT|nr:transcriptional regulator [Candidatus Magnetobacterium bavaricum]
MYQLSDGRCVKRKDKETVPVAFKEISFERQEIISREYDRCFVDGATVSDLDVELIKSLADNYLLGLSVERYLQQMGLAEYTTSGIRLRKAALLLFSKDTQKWYPRCQVRILKVNGTERKVGNEYNIEKDELIHGNIFELLVSSLEKLSSFLLYKTERDENNLFVPQYIYPYKAYREALTNAITHRDYSIQNGIEIFIFENRMEIKSPGSLLSTIDLEELRKFEGGIHESRNSFIAKVLRENEYLRELGEGLKNICNFMDKSELEKPEISTDASSFTITLYQKSVFSDRQLQWLRLFESEKLTRLQKNIILLGMKGEEISPNDIYRALKTNDSGIYTKETTPLIKTGILHETMSSLTVDKIVKEEGNSNRNDVPCFRIFPPEPMLKLNTDHRYKYPVEQGIFIFIANLDDVTSGDLISLFGQFGNIIEFNLIKSKGYGFLWYDNSESAKKILKKQGSYSLHGREIIVNKIRPKVDSKVTVIEEGLFIANLSENATAADLVSLFSQFGKVLDFRIVRNMGFGFLRYENPESNQKALRELNGYELHGQRIRVDKNRSFSEEQLQWLRLFKNEKLTHRQKRIILLGMNGDDISPNDIYHALSTDKDVIYNIQVNPLREIGILKEIINTYSAGLIAKASNIHIRDVKRFRIVPPGTDLTLPTVYKDKYHIEQAVFIYNLSDDATETDLRRLFGQLGNILEINLIKDRGMGFIWYEDPESDQRALKELNGHKLHDKKIRVDKIRPGTE